MLTKPEHEIAYQDVVALVRKHAGHLSAVEMLAVAANMLGKLIGLQDQRVLSPDKAMKIVAENIELGNKQLLDELQRHKGEG